MKKICYLFLIILLFTKCSPYKRAEKQLNKGNYAQAFETSMKVFTKNTSSDKKEKQLVLLQNAYLNANKKEEEELAGLKLQLSPNYKKIYYTTKSLYDRINRIKPLLPLYNHGKELKFPTKDYTAELSLAKENYLNQYYNRALDLLANNNKMSAREAYEYFSEVKGVDGNYRDVKNMLEVSYDKGVNIIYISFYNSSGIYLPSDFQNNLLWNLNNSNSNFWTIITTNSSDLHDEEVVVNINNATPGYDMENSLIHNYEREVVDGWEYEKDARGELIKDASKNPIKVDKYIRVRAQVTEIIRQKEARINATFQLYNSYTGSLKSTYPVSSGFIFSSSFGILNGNIKALDSYALNLVNAPVVPFPSNFDMLSQCSIELKNKLIDFINTF